jgi:hypothetical protein
MDGTRRKGMKVMVSCCADAARCCPTLLFFSRRHSLTACAVLSPARLPSATALEETEPARPAVRHQDAAGCQGQGRAPLPALPCFLPSRPPARPPARPLCAGTAARHKTATLQPRGACLSGTDARQAPRSQDVEDILGSTSPAPVVATHKNGGRPLAEAIIGPHSPQTRPGYSRKKSEEGGGFFTG